MAPTPPTPTSAWSRPRASMIALTVAVTLGVVVAGCGSDVGDTALARQVKARTEAADFDWGPAQTFDDFLPTTRFKDLRTGRHTDETGHDLNPVDLYVVGEVVSAVPGRYFTSQDDDETRPETIEVRPTDASWATVHVTLAPSLVIDAEGHRTDIDKVVFGLSVGASDADKIARELSRLGTIATPLFAGSPVFTYDPAIYGVPLEGALLAVVDDQERLGFPLASNHIREQFGLGRARTVSHVAATGKTPHDVDVVVVGGVTVRPDDTETLRRYGVDPTSLDVGA